MKKAASIAGYATMVGGILGLLGLRSLFANSVLTVALQSAAVLLMIWSRITFGRRSFHAAANPTAGGLVTWGPYRYIRNPIYASVCLFCTAAVLAHPSRPAAGLTVLIFASSALRIWCEEALLRQENPHYAEYARRTPRLVPFVF